MLSVFNVFIQYLDTVYIYVHRLILGIGCLDKIVHIGRVTLSQYKAPTQYNSLFSR